MDKQEIEKKIKNKQIITVVSAIALIGSVYFYNQYQEKQKYAAVAEQQANQVKAQLPSLNPGVEQNKTEEIMKKVEAVAETKAVAEESPKVADNLSHEDKIKRFEKSLIDNPDFVKRVNAKYPGLKVTSAKSIPQMKINVLTLENTMAVAFMNDEMTFIDIAGHMINPVNQEDISVYLAEIKANTFFTSLPFEKAIKVVYTDGKSDPAKNRRVAIFADPDCPYCRKMDQVIHTQLTNQNITFYYFMNPLRIPGHEQAPLKAAKIWCSGNSGKAWIEWMTKGVLPNNDGTCKNPVAETKQLSTSLGFNGTPTIVFDNNQVSLNDLTAEQIITTLNSKPPIKN